MSGVRGQRSGGHNAKSREQHLKDGTFRADRHSPYRQPSRQPLQLERHPMSILGWPGKREIAFLCEVSEATVTNWIKAGKIPAPSMKIERGRWIWHPDLLYSWLELGRPAAKEFDRLLEAAREDAG